MTADSRSGIQSDEDAIGAYLRNLGDLPRLSPEEEIFHAESFCSARADFIQVSCAFPGVWQDTLSTARTGEIGDCRESSQGSSGGRRDRLDAALQATEVVLEQFRLAGRERFPERRQLAAATLARSLGGLQIASNLCFRVMACIETYATRISATPTGTVPPELEHLVLMPATEFCSILPEISAAFKKLEAARSTLVESNLRLVISVCRKYRNCGLAFSDLIQEGNLGLIQAVDRFDPQRGHRFSTYAVWWIRQGITTALSNHGRTIRIPAHMASALHRIKQTEERLLQSLGREPSPAEIADVIDMDPQRVSALRKMAKQTISLQSATDDNDDRNVGDTYADENASRPDEDLSIRMLAEAIREVLTTLNEREQAILISRFGLHGAPTETLEVLSIRFGVSYERIRQIEAGALKKLRHPSRSQFFDGYN